MVDLVTGDVVVIRGDSIEEGNPGVCWSVPLVQGIQAEFRSSSPRASSAPSRYAAPGATSYDRGAPRFIHQGKAGDTAALMLADLSTRVYPYSPTGIIYECGVNDVTNGTALATFNANVTAIFNNSFANCPRLRWILWVGPICAGEKLPFGSNANDTTPPAVDANHTLLQVDTALRTLSASLGFTLVQFRNDAAGNGLWRDYQLANNVNNRSDGSGDYALAWTLDGRHLLARGAQNVSAAVRAQMTVVVP